MAKLFWVHTDSHGDLQSQIDRSRELARAQAWEDTPEHRALFRAWTVGIWASVANLGPKGVAEIVGEDPTLPSVPGSKYLVEPSPATRADNLAWQRTIAVAMAELAAKGKTQAAVTNLAAAMGNKTITLRTVDDGDPTREEAGLPIVAAIVIVAVAAIACWSTVELVAQKFQVDAKERELTRAITQSADIVDSHKARESAAGKDLPYDAGETSELDALRGAIKSTAGWTAPPLVSLPDLRGASQSAGTGLTWAFALVAAFFLYRATR